MPLYDFKCNKCGKMEERIVAMDVFGVTCECGGLKKRIISIPHIVLDGTNPSFPGAYDKWGRDREKRAEQNKKKSYYEG